MAAFINVNSVRAYALFDTGSNTDIISPRQYCRYDTSCTRIICETVMDFAHQYLRTHDISCTLAFFGAL
jgi:hypothetical protein